jgi:hypothetical protein
MSIGFHMHARERMEERGATEAEVESAIEEGERFEAKYNRVGFRRNFPLIEEWRGKKYSTKQVEVYAVPEGSDWLVITVITRYF